MEHESRCNIELTFALSVQLLQTLAFYSFLNKPFQSSIFWIGIVNKIFEITIHLFRFKIE